MTTIYKLIDEEEKTIFIGSWQACNSRMDHGYYVIPATREEEEEYFGLYDTEISFLMGLVNASSGKD